MHRTTGLALALVLAGVVLSWVPGALARVAWAQPCADNPLVGVEHKRLTLVSFRLESGQILPQVTLA